MMRGSYIVIRYCILLIVLAITYNGFSQNLVPNSSFEELVNLPVKPNPKRAFLLEPKSGYIPYQRNLKDWTLATLATPDLRILDPESLIKCKQRFGSCDEPHSGSNCAGIFTYLVNARYDQYREYLQVKLKEKLRPKETTFIEFWITKERQSKLVTNNLGFYFSMKRVDQKTKDVLKLPAQIKIDSIINLENKAWVKITASFIPKMPFSYLLIGNFDNNKYTRIEKFNNYDSLEYVPPYAYYLLDDIKVWQEGEGQNKKPLLEEIIENKKYEFNHVEFETDKSELRSSSFDELNEVVNYLSEHPEKSIEIHGHTDNQGAAEYNQELSEARAKAVAEYLIAKGINQEGVSYKGFGETKFLTGNTTDSERSKNRRVEFMIY